MEGHGEGYSQAFVRPAALPLRRRRLLKPQKRWRTSQDAHLGKAPLARPVAAKRRNPFANISNKLNLREECFDEQSTDGYPSNQEKKLCCEIGNGSPHGGDANEEKCSSTSISVFTTMSADPCVVPSFARTEPKEVENLGGDVNKVKLKDKDTLELLCGPDFPADWSIKVRAVFTSSRPFSWVDNLRSWEEARGLAVHLQDPVEHLPHTVKDPSSCAELRTGMQRALIYWSWPSLPWVTTFPRMESRGPSAQAPKASPWACSEAIQQALLSEWTTAFASLFSLLRAGLCPFFYVCVENFTTLFRAEGVAGEGGVSAVLSPTTSGFRDALRAEGIEFTMPFVVESRPHPTQPTQGSAATDVTACEAQIAATNSAVNEDEDEDEDEEEVEGEEEAENTAAWLRDLGVEGELRQMHTRTSAGKRSRQVDRRPESLVRIRAPYTHLLLNFLLSYRHLVPASGPHAGLPPTLLSPIAFRNASLHTLRVHSGCLNLPGKTGSKRYSMEIVGPILPHTLRVLVHLVKVAHDGDFHTALLTHTPTSALNATDGKTRGTTGGPLDSSVQPQQAALWRAPTLGKRALRELGAEGGAFNWTL
uniref:protein downstream neighbor of Son isoform X2 n=1 Tax=Myxine glutinosa TaxID=7769 RepID=UPI00358DED6A